MPDADEIKQDILSELDSVVEQKVEARLQQIQEQEHKQEETVESHGHAPVEVDGIDQEEFAHFNDRPYFLEQTGDQEYRFAVPAFKTDFQVGKFVGKAEDGRFNIFLLDPVTKTLHGLPEPVRDDPRIDIELEDDRFRVQGNYIYYDEQHRPELEQTEAFNKHLVEIGQTAAEIKHGHEFALLEALLNEGFDPFTPQPVDDEDLRDEPLVRDGFELRAYQEDWVDQVLDEGHGCFVGPTGSGKSYPTLYLFAALKGTKALICFGRMTVDQWHSYFETATQLDTVDLTDIDLDNPDLSGVDVIIGTYHSVEKLHQLVQTDAIDEFTAVATDESHALGADTFAAAATLPSKYTWGMTATPYREDGRTYAIQAFTGPYVGLDWDEILEQQGKERHTVHIHLVEDEDEKLRQAQDVYDPSKKTLLFTDSLDMGEDLADAFRCSFVHGDTSNQYDTVVEAIDRDGKCVVSRVGDHGLSIDGLEAIIEVDFLFGSRRQQLQRTGRLLHGYEGKEHHIIFTETEWEKHHKRVFSLLDREFDLALPAGVEIPDEYQDTDELEIEVSAETDVTESSQGSPATGDMDAVEVLQNDVVKEKLEERFSQTPGGYSVKKLKKAALLFAKRDDVTVPEVASVLDWEENYIKSGMAQVCKEPKIFEKVKDGNRVVRYNLNRDAVDDIIEAQRKREELEQELEDLGL